MREKSGRNITIGLLSANDVYHTSYFAAWTVFTNINDFILVPTECHHSHNIWKYIRKIIHIPRAKGVQVLSLYHFTADDSEAVVSAEMEPNLV